MENEQEKPQEEGSLESLSRGQRKFWLIWNIIESVILMAAGIIAIVIGFQGNNGDSDNNFKTIALVFSCVVGAYVILDGILRFLVLLFKFGKDSSESSMLLPAFEIAIGVVVILWHAEFLQIAIDFLSLLLTSVGTLMLIFAIFVLIKKQRKIFIPIMTIIFAAVILGIGVTMIILARSDNNNFYAAVNIGLGIIVAGVGLVQLIVVLGQQIKANKAAKANGEVPQKLTREEKKALKKAKEAEVEEVKQIEAKPVDEKPDEEKEEEEEEEEEEPKKKKRGLFGRKEKEEPIELDVLDEASKEEDK